MHDILSPVPGTWSQSPSGSCFRITVSVRVLSCKSQPWARTDGSRESVTQRLSGSSLNLQEGWRAGLWAQTGKHSWVRNPEACPRWVTVDMVATTAHGGGFSSYLRVPTWTPLRPPAPPHPWSPWCRWLTDLHHPHPCSCVSLGQILDSGQGQTFAYPSSSCWESWEWGLDFSRSLVWDRLYLPLIRPGCSNHRKELRCQTLLLYPPP